MFHGIARNPIGRVEDDLLTFLERKQVIQMSWLLKRIVSPRHVMKLLTMTWIPWFKSVKCWANSMSQNVNKCVSRLTRLPRSLCSARGEEGGGGRLGKGYAATVAPPCYGGLAVGRGCAGNVPLRLTLQAMHTRVRKPAGQLTF